MLSMKLFRGRVAFADEAASRQKDEAMSTSLASNRTESTVASDYFSDETREDLTSPFAELAFSDDDDDNWRNDFLSPGSAISKEFEGRKSKPPPQQLLSPVTSADSQEETSSPPTSSPTVSFSESQQVTSEPALNSSQVSIRTLEAPFARTV